tara:strand:- start:927 stop:1661 length:735 start_codon:yes stop_codon:yes gene_type:complete
MIRRVGGKSKLKKKIVSLMPKHKTYVEAFVGGGHVLFEKKPAEINIINDKDIDIAHIYGDMKAVGDKMINKDFTGNRDKFFRLLNQKKFNNTEERLYRNLYISINSFAGNRKSYMGPNEEIYRQGSNIGKKYKSTKYKDFLNNNNVKIFNTDFKNIIKKYDSKDTLFYLDPPYSKSTKDYKHSVNPNDVYKALQGLKSKFILSYDHSPEIKKIFNKYKFKTVTTSYDMSGVRQGDIKEYLITNF